MFWKRSRRAARRQRVLEELLWLDPIDRERRVIAAVAAGEFSAAEIDAALRLVNRLDSLRVLSLPPGGRLVGGQPFRFPERRYGDEPDFEYDHEMVEPLIGFRGPEQTSPAPSIGDGGSPRLRALPRDESASDELVGMAIVSDTAAGPLEPDVVGIAVVPDAEAGGVLSYGSLGAEEASARNASSAEPMALPVDALESAERLIAPRRADAGGRAKSRSGELRVAEASPEWQAQTGPDAAPVGPQTDEVWPSINWLRPN
jgi:hypothetical protein